MSRIHILLPHKEIMTDQNAGAIATVTAQNVRLTSSGQKFTVFGRSFQHPVISGITYQPLIPRHSWISGQNIGIARAYIDYLKTAEQPDLIEVHGRAQVARYLCKKCPSLPVVLYLHNDPHGMKGARTVSERAWLIKHLAGIICVSDYIKSCFLDGLSLETVDKNAIHWVLNGAERHSKTPPAKKNHILIVGRMVPEKGILPACQAVADVLAQQPEWMLDVVGGRHFKTEFPSAYEKHIRKTLASVEKQIRIHGFQPAPITRELQQQAAISIVPSLWAEPCGLTGLEALAAGSALITTDRGGIVEYATDRAEVIGLSGTELSDKAAEERFIQELSARLLKLTKDTSYRETLQQKAWKDFPFTAENMAAQATVIRQRILSRFTNRLV